jgi:hypothetical protein
MEGGSRFPPRRYETYQNRRNYGEITWHCTIIHCVYHVQVYNRGQRTNEWVELKLLRAVAKIVAVEELMRSSLTIRVSVRSESDLGLMQGWSKISAN